MSLTRKEFLRSFVPPWLAKRVILVAIMIGGGLFVAREFAKIVREQGFVASLAGAGIGPASG